MTRAFHTRTLPGNIVETGEFENELLTGQGKRDRNNGALIEEGFFVQGKLHGQGLRKNVLGSFEQGVFSEGELHGSGYRQYANGVSESGVFDAGFLREGKYENPSVGSSCVGKFNDDGLLHGEGRKVSLGVLVEEGNFNNGQLDGVNGNRVNKILREHGTYSMGVLHGEGSRAYKEDGIILRGRFEQGALVKGLMQSPDFKMEGDFEGDNLVEGTRSSRINDDFSRGRFKDGRLYGKGVVYSDGDFIEGIFEDGQLHGLGIITSFGNSLEGEFKHGKLDGYGSRTFCVGDVEYEQGQYVDGALNGVGERLFRRGVLEVGEYKNDKPVGYIQCLSESESAPIKHCFYFEDKGSHVEFESYDLLRDYLIEHHGEDFVREHLPGIQPSTHPDVYFGDSHDMPAHVINSCVAHCDVATALDDKIAAISEAVGRLH